MSTKKLIIGSEIFEYPIVGTGNYGEEATAWAEAATDVLAEVRGPGDIGITQVSLIGTSGNIPGLKFDTSFVQKVTVTGLITRRFTEISGIPQEVESFVVEGSFNGVEFNLTQEFSGDDTDFQFSEINGQFRFTTISKPNTLQLNIKFQAKAVIDQEVL